MREGFLKFTRKAYNSLPKLVNPKILEIGCGSGLVTIELARLSKAKIIGIDIDQRFIEGLSKQILEEGLVNQITVEKMNFLQNQFKNNEFDIIWEEGVIHVIGFKESFKECNRVLKKGGFLVIGQAIKGISQNLALIENCGFELIEELKWTEGCWWAEYYEPLQRRINEMREDGYGSNFFDNIAAIEEEIEMVKADPKKFDCAHYILKKVKDLRGND